MTAFADDTPLQISRHHVGTDDPEQASEIMRAAYTDHRATVSGDSSGFTFDMNCVDVGSLQTARTRHSMGFLGPSAPADNKLIVVQPAGGTRLRMTCRDEEATETAMLAPTWAPFTADWDDVVFTSVTMDESRVARLGAQVTGLSPTGFRFRGMAPVSAELERYWHAVVARTTHGVLGMESPPQLLLAEALRSLGIAMLAVFPNSTHTVDPPSGRDRGGEPAVVRRAMEFIEANARRDVGLDEIADAARIGPRGLQSAFRKHRSQTPLEYLRRVRMAGAHRDLQDADPTQDGVTVAGVAAHWGFGHPGRFAVEYRRLYGCSPSHTLRR